MMVTTQKQGRAIQTPPEDDADLKAAVKTIRAFGWKITSVAGVLLVALVITIPKYLISESEARASLTYATKAEVSAIQADVAAIKADLAFIKESLNRIESKLK
jgi:hypothetical protein